MTAVFQIDDRYEGEDNDEIPFKALVSLNYHRLSSFYTNQSYILFESVDTNFQ